MVSIGTVGLALHLVVSRSFPLQQIMAKTETKISVSLLAFFFLQLVGLGFNPSYAPIWTELKTKLPFLVIPLAWMKLPPLKSQHKKYIYLFFITTIICVTLTTLAHYALHFEAINASILQSKSMPIISLSKSISHIYFSFMVCFAIGLCWAKELNTVRYWLRIGISLFLVVMLHIFATRTGLVAFYISALAAAFILLLERKVSISKVIGGVSVILLLIISFYYFPSLQNRVNNTIEDWQVWNKQKNIGYYSLSNRFFVWQAGVNMVKEKPFTGIGPAAIPEALERYYAERLPEAPLDNRLRDFHNQWLEYSVGLGVPLTLVLLFCFFSPLFFWRRLEQPLLYAYFISTLFFTSLSESVLERQMGITFFLVFQLLLTTPLKIKRKEEEKKLHSTRQNF
jgi:O-antigen ligase